MRPPGVRRIAIAPFARQFHTVRSVTPSRFAYSLTVHSRRRRGGVCGALLTASPVGRCGP
jgi:hypothetical protein